MPNRPIPVKGNLVFTPILAVLTRLTVIRWQSIEHGIGLPVSETEPQMDLKMPIGFGVIYFVEFVTRHGGTAGTFQPKDYIARPDWDLVKDFLLGNIDLANFKQQVGC